MTALAIPMVRIGRPLIGRWDELALNVLHELQARKVRLLCGIKEANVIHSPVSVDSRAPLLSLRFPVDADKTGGVIALHRFVAAVIAIARLAQIFYAVVRSVAIDVIDLASRVLAIEVKPRKPVSLVGRTAHHLDHSVSNVGNEPGFFASVPTIPFSWARRADAPAENSRHGIVIQNLSEKFRRDIGPWRAEHPILHRSQWSEPIMAAMTGQAIVTEN
jgi:hypothetical protein